MDQCTVLPGFFFSLVLRITALTPSFPHSRERGHAVIGKELCFYSVSGRQGVADRRPLAEELTQSRRQQKKKQTEKLSLHFFPQDFLSLCTIEYIVSKMTLGQILKIIKVILP